VQTMYVAALAPVCFVPATVPGRGPRPPTLGGDMTHGSAGTPDPDGLIERIRRWMNWGGVRLSIG
jgi:hypothetical protein